MNPTNPGILDFKGNYGLYAQIYYIPIKNINVKKMEAFFNSDNYNTLVKSITTSQFLKDSFVKYIDINQFLINPNIKRI